MARQPLIAPLAKFQKSEGVAGLGGADVDTTLASAGVSGDNTTGLFKLIFTFSESVIGYIFSSLFPEDGAYYRPSIFSKFVVVDCEILVSSFCSGYLDSSADSHIA